MKNKPYPLYKTRPIRNLRDMLLKKQQSVPGKTAFMIPVGRGKITEKTYDEFYRDVSALGTWLLMQGFHGRHIGIIGENSYEWLVAFCAIVNSGNVAVPIDRELPTKEAAALLRKADVEAVFISRTCRNAWEKAESAAGESMKTTLRDIGIIFMENMAEYIEKGKQRMVEGDCCYQDFVPDPEALCCILFTSGTSGLSKGVMLSHKNMAEDIVGSCKLVELKGGTVALLPFHHAFGLVAGVFAVFHYGYPIYLNRSLKEVSQSLVAAHPQNLFLVPLFVETFYRQIWGTARKEGKDKALRKLMKFSDILLRLGIDIRRICFSSVRKALGGELEYIICGGAALDVTYVREFRSWGIEILNGYGTTECSPVTAVNRNLYHRDGTVGLPLPGTEIAIAEDGEVLIRGPHVMLGYYKEEAATAEVLRDGWYATGDLGFADADGFITLTGRKKNLIILSNGENVSPEELERDFLRDAAVREVVVYAENGVIVAEIFQDEDFWAQETVGKKDAGNRMSGKNPTEQEEYFQNLMRRVNQGRPSYKQVGRVKLRETEFEKNTSRKIIRHR